MCWSIVAPRGKVYQEQDWRDKVVEVSIWAEPEGNYCPVTPASGLCFLARIINNNKTIIIIINCSTLNSH